MGTFKVTTLIDEDNGTGGTGLSLREAVKLANASKGTDRIIFDPKIGGAGAVAAVHRGTGVIDLPDHTFDTSVRVDPRGSLAAAVEKYDDGGTLFILGRGTHYGQEVIPNHGDAFVGEPGAIMDGAKLLANWQRVGDKYAHQVDLPPASQVIHNGKGPGGEEAGPIVNGNPTSIVGYPEQLFLTYPVSSSSVMSLGQRVATIEEVKGTKWFLDYANDRVVIEKPFNSPYGPPIVALGQAKFAFGYDADAHAGKYALDRVPGQPLPTMPSDLPNIYSPADPNYDKPRDVIIQNLTIQHYANPAQTGAIGYFRPGLDWQIENNVIRWNNGAGIKFRGDDAIVRDNIVQYNGQLGIGAGDGNTVQSGNLEEWGFYGGYAGAGGLVQNNDIAWNRLAPIGIDPRWEAGGTKFSQTFDLRVLGNLVHDNDGPGLWTDFAYAGTRIEGNKVENNKFDGIFVEIPTGSTSVTGNIVRYNGIEATDSGPEGAQIRLSTASLAEVANNEVYVSSEFGKGITLNDDGNRNVEGIPVHGYGSYVHDNRIFVDGTSRAIPSGATENDLGPGWTGGQGTRPDGSYDPHFYSINVNRFDDNEYFLGDQSNNTWRMVKSADGGYWRWFVKGAGEYPEYLQFQQWQAAGQDIARADTGADTLVGTTATDLLVGGGGNDELASAGGNDALYGEDGDDVLRGGPGADYLAGGVGSDMADYRDSPSGVTLLLSATDRNGVGGVPSTIGKPAGLSGGDASGDTIVGIEKVRGSGAADLVFGFDTGTTADLGGGNDIFDNNETTVVVDRVSGGAGSDKIWTGAGNDRLDGGSGDDALYGEAGNDTIIGGLGKDLLFGGSGKDIFDYNEVDPLSYANALDVIGDFAKGEIIDLSTLDAFATIPGNQRFSFVGPRAFFGEGQVRAHVINGDTIVEASLDRDLAPELAINLDNYVTPLGSSAFVL